MTETIRFTTRPIVKTSFGKSALLSEETHSHKMQWLRIVPLNDVDDLVIENGRAFVYEDEGPYIAVKTSTDCGYRMVSERYVWAYI